MTDDKTRRRPAPLRDHRVAEQEPGLLVLQGPGAGGIHRLDQPHTIVGRGDEADLRIVDDGVSRKHVKLIRGAGGLINVLDLGSTNGVFVNGAKVDLGVLQLGDVLELGPDVRLRLVDAAAPVSKPAHEGAAALGLTDRQLDIARLVAGGLTNAAIAEHLEISPRTVTSHLDHVYTRLGISSRAALVTRLAAAGLLPAPGRP
jgi:DNA-binding CsgD family transcriptional regulator